MKKAHIAALEKVFANEIEQALKPESFPRYPFQSKAKVFEALEAEGWLRRETVVCDSGWMMIDITGWKFTDIGRYTYCMTCTDEPQKAAA